MRKNRNQKNIFNSFAIFPLCICILTFTFKAQHVTAEYLQPKNTLIVISDKPNNDESKSASLLSKWLNNIYQTDSAFLIVKASKVGNIEGKLLINIGETKFTPAEEMNTQEPYSFIINRKAQVITILGATPLGTFMGTTYFLDHFCGVRFYLPTDLFVSLPVGKKINLSKSISVSQTPFTKYVYSSGYKNYIDSNYKNVTESYWSQINALNRKNWGSHQHSMGDRFYDDSIFKMFPEIFPIVNGQRYFPKSKQDQKWEPDFVEPTLVDAAVYSAIKYFKANPGIDYISFSVQDSYVYPTEGKMGAYMKNYPNTKEGRKRGYTNAFVEFLNKLAVRLEIELPKNGITTPKTIVYLVYGNVSYVPEAELRPNILPILVNQLASASMGILKEDDPRLTQWSSVTTRIGNDDWAEGKGFIYPRIYTSLVSEFLKKIKDDKMSFEYAHLESYPNWSLDGPKYYFMSKIYWNPEVDTDSLLNLFCIDMFGKAAKKMQSYFNTLEDLNTSMNNDRARVRQMNNYQTQLSLNEKELNLVSKARQNIDKAYSIAETDTQKKRIDFFSKGFKISEGFFELYNSNGVDTTKANKLKDYLKNEIARNPMMLNVATDKNFLDVTGKLIDQIVKKKMISKTPGNK